MPHDISLVSTIAVCLAFAFIGGFLATRLRLPPIVGYLLAGVVAGPFTPGYVADTRLAPQLAEIGVMLLMFGVDMHFSLRDLLAVRRIALPGAIAQIVLVTLLGLVLALLWGWSPGAGLVLGLALSVASTVVLLRALRAQGTLASPDGRIAVGWLVVEDLVTVLVLVVLPGFATALGGTPVEHAGAGFFASLGVTLAKLAVFLLLMLVVGSRVLPWLLDQAARTGHRDLFTLAVVAAALGIAYGSAEFFDVSFALGAFFAGVVVGGSDHSHRAAVEMRPLQDAFAVLFFVSVGMLFDPVVLVEEPQRVLAVLAVILIGKVVAALLILWLCRQPLATALTVAAGLAQIGEFSFILAELGVTLKLLPAAGQQLVLAGSLLSIALNPLLFRAAAAAAARWAPAPAAPGVVPPGVVPPGAGPPGAA